MKESNQLSRLFRGAGRDRPGAGNGAAVEQEDGHGKGVGNGH